MKVYLVDTKADWTKIFKEFEKKVLNVRILIIVQKV